MNLYIKDIDFEFQAFLSRHRSFVNSISVEWADMANDIVYDDVTESALSDVITLRDWVQKKLEAFASEQAEALDQLVKKLPEGREFFVIRNHMDSVVVVRHFDLFSSNLFYDPDASKMALDVDKETALGNPLNENKSGVIASKGEIEDAYEASADFKFTQVSSHGKLDVSNVLNNLIYQRLKAINSPIVHRKGKKWSKDAPYEYMPGVYAEGSNEQFISNVFQGIRFDGKVRPVELKITESFFSNSHNKGYILDELSKSGEQLPYYKFCRASELLLKHSDIDDLNKLRLLLVVHRFAPKVSAEFTCSHEAADEIVELMRSVLNDPSVDAKEKETLVMNVIGGVDRYNLANKVVNEAFKYEVACVVGEWVSTLDQADQVMDGFEPSSIHRVLFKHISKLTGKDSEAECGLRVSCLERLYESGALTRLLERMNVNDLIKIANSQLESIGKRTFNTTHETLDALDWMDYIHYVKGDMINFDQNTRHYLNFVEHLHYNLSRVLLQSHMDEESIYAFKNKMNRPWILEALNNRDVKFVNYHEYTLMTYQRCARNYTPHNEVDLALLRYISHSFGKNIENISKGIGSGKKLDIKAFESELKLYANTLIEESRACASYLIDCVLCNPHYTPASYRTLARLYQESGHDLSEISVASGDLSLIDILDTKKDLDSSNEAYVSWVMKLKESLLQKGYSTTQPQKDHVPDDFDAVL